MYCTVSIYGITSGKVEVGGLQRKYDAVVEVDQLGTRNESSAAIYYLHTHSVSSFGKVTCLDRHPIP